MIEKKQKHLEEVFLANPTRTNEEDNEINAYLEIKHRIEN